MIAIANAPCSWGVLEFDLEGKAAGYPQVLDEMCQTGYDGTELGDWGFMPTDPVALWNELAARRLALLGAFVPVNFRDPSAHAAGEALALRTARLLAEVQKQTVPSANASAVNPFIILADDNGKDPVRTQNAGRIGPGQGLSPEQWTTFASGVERIARAVRDATGLRAVFHHHCAGFVETPREVETLLQRTSEELVGLCLDTGHYLFGGGDPVSAIEQYGKRIWHMHFKDCSPALAERARREEWDYFTSLRHGIFCELGKGAVDFPGVVAALRRLGFSGWGVVEQDVLPGMGSPRECAQRNRTYLRTIGL